MADDSRTEHLRGAVDLLILRSLAAGATHGWGIGRRIQQRSSGVLEMNQGSLYPALQRLEQRGLVTSAWETTDANRQAKVYTLTARGRRALARETESWRRYARAVEMVLAPGRA